MTHPLAVNVPIMFCSYGDYLMGGFLSNIRQLRRANFLVRNRPYVDKAAGFQDSP